MDNAASPRSRPVARRPVSRSPRLPVAEAHAGDLLFEEVPRLPPGVAETFAHPVLDGAELRAYDRDYADLRAHDAGCLTDPAVSDLWSGTASSASASASCATSSALAERSPRGAAPAGP
jgi:hypothetical protein